MPKKGSLGKVERLVVKLSGSLFQPDVKYSDIQPFTKLFSDLRRSGIKMVLVAGGGKNARTYINAARGLGADESTLDELGIMVSRLNAMLMIVGLGESAYPSVPTSLAEVAKAFNETGLVVVGGLHPGQSTNAVACLIAERIRADLFLNTTSVDGVYTANPKTSKAAKRLSTVSTKELEKILSGSAMGAGTYELMDPVALRIIERSKIPSRITLCSTEVIKQVLNGENVGTILTSGK
ncbi:MAG: UMP kinase [Thaumarchaeota archaeon]|nr:UMP kinase [Nitrososphaerota archaeon]MCL5318115.1 UMP kinase [Nitrososphaerota archaeon]